MSIKGKRYLSYQEGVEEMVKIDQQIKGGSNGPSYSERLPVVHRGYFLKHYLGVLLTSIEVLGLPERQEKSFKDVVKMNFWKFVEDGFIVPMEVDAELTPRMEELVDAKDIMTEEEARKAGIDVDNIQKENGTELLNI